MSVAVSSSAEHTRDHNLVANVPGKTLTNIHDDELVEVTPKSIRLRKKLLDETERKRDERRKEAEQVA